MGKPKSSFLAAIDRMEAAARKKKDEVVRSNEFYSDSPNTSWRAGQMYERHIADAGSAFYAKQATYDRLRELAPMVDGGLLSAAEALKMVGLSESLLAAADVIAAPDKARLQRERNDEINAANDACERAEKMFGLRKRALGRTTRARSDSIDLRHFYENDD